MAKINRRSEPETKKGAGREDDRPGSGSSLREDAEKQLPHAEKNLPRFSRQTPEELIHELQVHQIELEMQAEELRRAQLALEESRDKYFDLYEMAPQGYLTLTDKGLICEANLTGATLLGVERKNLAGSRFAGYVEEKDDEAWNRYFQNVLGRKENLTCTLMLTRADGLVFPARLESIRVNGSTDQKPTVRVGFSDISDIRKTEDALRISNKKLNLLSSVTRHDINNQLVTLNAYIGLVQEGIKGSAQEEDFAHVSEASGRIAKIIHFTKEFEQLGTGEPRWQECRALVDSAAGQAGPGQITVKNHLPVGMEVLADPLFGKVFSSLIDNAVRHGGKVRTICFSVQESGNDRRIICEDDGDGVAADEKELIFARGFGKNTGFGLTFSREILDITGITIRENGEQGRGARFEMAIPPRDFRIGVRKIPGTKSGNTG